MEFDTGLLLVRIAVGALVTGHGAQKLFGWFGGPGVAGTAGFFASLGYPAPRAMAVAAGATEFGAGLLLAFGIALPLAAAGLIGVMVNAAVTVHFPNGLWVQDGGFEYPLVLVVIAISLALIGPGAYSLAAATQAHWHGPVPVVAALVVGSAGALVALAARRPRQDA